jgi:hypothetical protein
VYTEGYYLHHWCQQLCVSSIMFMACYVMKLVHSENAWMCLCLNGSISGLHLSYSSADHCWHCLLCLALTSLPQQARVITEDSFLGALMVLANCTDSTRVLCCSKVGHTHLQWLATLYCILINRVILLWPLFKCSGMSIRHCHIYVKQQKRVHWCSWRLEANDYISDCHTACL